VEPLLNVSEYGERERANEWLRTQPPEFPPCPCGYRASHDPETCGFNFHKKSDQMLSLMRKYRVENVPDLLAAIAAEYTEETGEVHTTEDAAVMLDGMLEAEYQILQSREPFSSNIHFTRGPDGVRLLLSKNEAAILINAMKNEKDNLGEFVDTDLPSERYHHAINYRRRVAVLLDDLRGLVPDWNQTVNEL
jgi:hypothetical protein